MPKNYAAFSAEGPLAPMARARRLKVGILGRVGEAVLDHKHDSLDAGRAALPRARGQALLHVAGEGRTRIADLRQQGSLKLVFPRQRTPCLPAVLVNTAGGVTGGDVFSLNAQVGSQASLSLTTQAAERIYRSVSGQPGRISAEIDVAAGGRLFWLPQETIVFDGAALERRLCVNLCADARCLVLESVVFGRAAMREKITRLAWRDEILVSRDGAPVFWDRQTITEAFFDDMAASVSRHGHDAMAVFVLAAPGAGDACDTLREIAARLSALPLEIGVSALSEELLIVRILAQDGYCLRQAVHPLARGLTGEDLPKVWML